MSATLKKRAPLWIWAVLLIVVITIAVAVTMHVVGLWDLSFIPALFIGWFQWAGTDILNASLTFIGIFALGLLTFWFYKSYIAGTKVPAGAMIPQTPYIPRGAELSSTPNTVVTVEEKPKE